MRTRVSRTQKSNRTENVLPAITEYVELSLIHRFCEVTTENSQLPYKRETGGPLGKFIANVFRQLVVSTLTTNLF